MNTGNKTQVSEREMTKARQDMRSSTTVKSATEERMKTVKEDLEEMLSDMKSKRTAMRRAEERIKNMEVDPSDSE